MKKIFLFTIFLLLLVVPLSMAQVVPFQQPTFLEGFTIKYPANGIIEQGQDYQFNFHIFNTSNGVPIISGIECHFHLYNATGQHQLSLEESTFTFEYDIAFNISGGNFSETGEYSYLVQCNSTTQGGYDSIPFSVTPTGLETTEGQGIVVIGLLLITMILAIFFGWIGFKFIEREKLAIEGMIFLIASLFLSTIPLMLAYLFSRDILFSLAVTEIMFRLWYAMFWILFALVVLRMLVFLIQVMKQVLRVREQKRHGEGYNMKTKQYE